ncbi:LysE family transporter [Microbacterium mangrovi]|uniref:LysE family transporter n=1 Tax=Microbacterium mangrovi TaxID=1348253 RepID=UPI000AE79CAD|nr:LysE family transporter [Microbacterium mangrovi]
MALAGGRASARGAYLRFVGLTAVNPLTLVYFVALGGAVVSPGDTWGVPVAFVAAGGLASLAWQLVLATSGAVSRRAVGARGVRWIGAAASAVVVALGIGVLVSGVGGFGAG